jgi:Tfp pilus assembly protein PilW
VEVPSDERFTFTVDYAGAVADTTPPSMTNLAVDLCLNSTTTAAASWSATDPNSAITLYRYALGCAPNSTDVTNWTSTAATSVTRTGLNLVTGRQYFFSVQARNAGGLWSAVTSRSFVAGVPCSKVYLPLVVR